MLKALGVALLLASSAFAADDADVVVLTESNFDDHLKDNPKTLVEFYAPWCGHCKRLAPEYAQAATALKDVAPLGKVDCTAEKELCSKYEVNGYPTIKWFTDGEASDYTSGRDAAGIEKFVLGRMRPAVSILDDKDKAPGFTDSSSLVFVAYGDEQPGDFAKMADHLRDEVVFGFTSDADVAESIGVAKGKAILFRQFDEPQVNYDGDFSLDNLSDFLNENSFPLVGEIGPENYSKYIERGLPLVWLAVDPEADNKDLIAEASKAAADFTGEISFVSLDGVKFAAYIQSLGFSGDLPGVILTHDREKFIMDKADGVTAAAMKKFASGFKEGTLEPFLKSEEVPAKQDEPVYTLVGKSFEAEVLSVDKHVLVEFYAPWCGHCKKLEPEYTQLGTNWAGNDNVRVAKMDATANDAKGVDISGFPTIYLYKKDGKDKPVTYDGKRTEEDISKWLADQTGESPVAAKDEL
jgi:protein disulfide-isomerase A1